MIKTYVSRGQQSHLTAFAFSLTEDESTCRSISIYSQDQDTFGKAYSAIDSAHFGLENLEPSDHIPIHNAMNKALEDQNVLVDTYDGKRHFHFVHKDGIPSENLLLLFRSLIKAGIMTRDESQQIYGDLFQLGTTSD